MRRWAAVLMLLAGGTARAASLSIALQSDIAALDPHVAPSQTGEAVLRHVYDTLVDRDAELKFVPGLATSWRLVSPTAWDFTLRQGVVFSDGTPLKAEDIAFSIARAGGVSSSVGTYAPYVRAIRSVSIPTSDVVRIETVSPYPQLLGDLVRIGIVRSRPAATEAFNDLSAAIGTGAFRVERWSPGGALQLVRNAKSWHPAGPWDTVSIQPVANDAARLVALMSGAVDLIDKVPMSDIERLRVDPRFRLFVHEGNRSMFLAPNFAPDSGAYVIDDRGKRLQPNPLLNPKVREALSRAINRSALVERVMAGMGAVANEVVPAGMFGFDGSQTAEQFNVDAAKRLLAEAGYPNGFRLVLHCSNGRYVNDRATCLAVAQMMARIGVQSDVQAEPQAVFYARLSRQDFDLVLNGWGSDTGDSIVVLRQALHSVDPAKGLGGFNRGHYANAEVDRLIVMAAGALEPDTRLAVQRQAMRLAMEEKALIPLYTSAWVWGARRGISYQGSYEEGTLAMRASPEP